MNEPVLGLYVCVAFRFRERVRISPESETRQTAPRSEYDLALATGLLARYGGFKREP